MIYISNHVVLYNINFELKCIVTIYLYYYTYTNQDLDPYNQGLFNHQPQNPHKYGLRSPLYR